MSQRVLVIGGGGREHAICWKLSQSPKISQIYALPGSYGIQQVDKCQNLDAKVLDPKDFEVGFCPVPDLTLDRSFKSINGAQCGG